MKRYGARKVVRDVSVSVKSGEVVGLLGPNGAGKTTTFYMIVGLGAAQRRRHSLKRQADYAPADLQTRSARRVLPSAGSKRLSQTDR